MTKKQIGQGSRVEGRVKTILKIQNVKKSKLYQQMWITWLVSALRRHTTD